MIDNKVVNDVTTKKKYVKPEIEVFDIDSQTPLLAASPNRYTPQWGDYGSENI